MSKADYSVEDFILDPDFRSWILQNDRQAGAYWEEFLGKHPEKVSDIKQARHLLIHLSQKKTTLSSMVKEEMWTAISVQMDQQPLSDTEAKIVNLNSWSAIQQYNQENARKTTVAWRRKVAVVLLLLAGLSYFLGKTLLPKAEEPVMASAPEIEVLQAPLGVKSTIRLEDGSVVFLNSGSKISYLKGFTDTLRLVTLEGEAYFEVAPDSTRPFIVQTGAISTRALGTEFNVSSFPGERVSVSLVKGEVLVRNEQEALEQRLLPGEGIKASSEDKALAMSRFDPEEVLSWMNKTLIFNQSPFSKASKKLEAWYGVELIFQNSVPKDLHVSGKFIDESLENILKGLSYSSRFSYRIEGKKVHIQFNS
jgi:transmembrane sensor